ncbi:3-beta hydroxysteroid dehydrogenase [Desulfonema ishimotonii]|uniref:3-beta hydroxysteroid dehydrogenase n=1 Tax=Desulfonema ishimotonii TaxID=45657 RepID=A0A401FSU5_9BACT|nr:NAD-dependent epimerase/dehydratase family protein [Desulfonema ishimotonii]GBC60023.1 3-beta hydroxysteroid dehydrogenase [Desulfonema ishimotonii]
MGSRKIAEKSILVTGGGGFLGGAIVRQLAERGETVRTFSRGSYSDLDALGVTQIRGDLSDPAAVEKACDGVELVFHTAARPGVWGKYADYFDTNVTGTRNVLEACRKQGVERLVHTSSPSVVFNGTDMAGVDESVPWPSQYHAHYPRTKALAEQAVIQAAKEGLRTVILRPHLIWGPGDNHLVPRIIRRARSLMIVGDGKNPVDTIYIDNAADAHMLAAEKLRRHPGLSGRIYFISQDAPMPLWDMVNAILKAGGKPPVRRRISAKTARIIGAALEWAYTAFRLNGEPKMTRFVADELATAHWFDISAAKRDLGYVPRVSTEEGLRRLALWLRENPAD